MGSYVDGCSQARVRIDSPCALHRSYDPELYLGCINFPDARRTEQRKLRTCTYSCATPHRNKSDLVRISQLFNAAGTTRGRLYFRQIGVQDKCMCDRSHMFPSSYTRHPTFVRTRYNGMPWVRVMQLTLAYSHLPGHAVFSSPENSPMKVIWTSQ